MADNKLLQQMLEHLVNDEQQKAEELFHEYVVAKSREIYEGLIESEIAEEDEKEHNDDEDKDQKKNEEIEEDFEEITVEDDIEEGPDMMGGDGTDDLESELDADMDKMDDDEEDEKDEEELFQDLEAIVDELQAKFDELKGEQAPEMSDEPMKDSIEAELETVREYVEKVPAGHGAEKKGVAEKADNTKSTIDNMKNDMGGTVENIVRGGVEPEGASTKGGLLNPSTKEDNAGNINVPGGKAGSAFSTKEPGHGAEKKGAAEQADNKQSLFRGRR